MILWWIFLSGALATAGIFRAAWKLFWGRQNGALRAAGAMLGICAVLIALAGAELFPVPKRVAELVALNEKNENGEGTEIYLSGFTLDGDDAGIPQTPMTGQWVWYNGRYCWFRDGDKRHQPGMTEKVSFALETAWSSEVRFLSNKWKGRLLVRMEGQTIEVDTFSPQEDGMMMAVSLPRPPAVLTAKAILFPVMGYALTLTALCAAFSILGATGKQLGKRLSNRLPQNGRLQKLLGYQFLFEELVKRDFKKKYKRTVLGMVWSVLSPLLTLMVMKLVFTQFFGRNTPHYTIYLFCGNLVFSYFNESTSQGMTSLVGNAGIFTKVNVPKYLFLFSKNVQTLINFALTMCVFLLFCIMDRITFTWKFICLLYPILMLMLFNIGTGLVLSALYVFFKDIQYLWSVFTMLLMYISAIFYTIDSYSPMVQNLFLLNPVYLFIRYFRKIVIEATIPTAYFHLLMLADVAVVLGLGCWIYKKYNHKFLYYV